VHEDQVSVFMSPSDSVAQLYPQALSLHFIDFYDSELRWRYYNPPPHGTKIDSAIQKFIGGDTQKHIPLLNFEYIN
jgi:hypothetical protein